MDSFVDVVVPNYVAATEIWPRLAMILGILVIGGSFALRECVEGMAAEQFLPSELLAFLGFLAMAAGWLFAGAFYVLFFPVPGVPEGGDPTFWQSMLNGPGVLFLSALVWLGLSFLAAFSGRAFGRGLRIWLRG